MRLFLALMIAGSLSLPSYAEDGLVFPDSADVSCQREIINDTVTVTINNLSSDSVINFYLVDFTDSLTVEIECLVDSVPSENIVMEHDFGGVYLDKYTTRWVIGNFLHSLCLRYYSRFYSSDRLNWSAGRPYPIYGTMPVGHSIGPPQMVHWAE